MKIIFLLILWIMLYLVFLFDTFDVWSQKDIFILQDEIQEIQK